MGSTVRQGSSGSDGAIGEPSACRETPTKRAATVGNVKRSLIAEGTEKQ